MAMFDSRPIEELACLFRALAAAGACQGQGQKANGEHDTASAALKGGVRCVAVCGPLDGG